MESIGIIGSGIAGMTCAWYLRDHYDVTLLEKDNYIGGHTNTVIAKDSEGDVPIDTGFMVFNDHTYPNLIKLFNELEVPAVNTNMSFGVSNELTGFTYSTSGLNGFFANKVNLFNPKYWSLVKQIRRFFHLAHRLLEEGSDHPLSLEEFLKQHSLDGSLAENFIYPMASAIWSTHNENIGQYPARSLFNFMKNHGLLGIGTQFIWKTIRGGSRVYRDRILRKLPNKPITKYPIQHVKENEQHVTVTAASGEQQTFDYVIVATHADEALSLLAEPTDLQRELLSPFKYNYNSAVLHTDESVMPKNKQAWSSWNYKSEALENGGMSASTHYWMNNLQHLQSRNNYFVSIDYQGDLDPSKVVWSKNYTHPCFNQATLNAQQSLPSLNEKGRIMFCGSYFRHGFHEDAHVSGLEIVKKLKQMKGLHHEILPV